MRCYYPAIKWGLNGSRMRLRNRVTATGGWKTCAIKNIFLVFNDDCLIARSRSDWCLSLAKRLPEINRHNGTVIGGIMNIVFIACDWAASSITMMKLEKIWAKQVLYDPRTENYLKAKVIYYTTCLKWVIASVTAFLLHQYLPYYLL